MAALSSTDFCTLNRNKSEIAFSDGNHDGRAAETSVTNCVMSLKTFLGFLEVHERLHLVLTLFKHLSSMQ